jgi:hypothetical protein
VIAFAAVALAAPPVVEATIATEALNPDGPGPFEFTCTDRMAAAASSTLEGKVSYEVGHLIDRDLRTAWVEGVDGSGVGEWVDITLRATDPPGDFPRFRSSFLIANGYVTTDAIWKKNARVKTMTALVGEQELATVKLLDSRTLQWFDLPDIPGLYERDVTVRFRIDSVYPGTKYEDTCLSQLVARCLN